MQPTMRQKQARYMAVLNTAAGFTGEFCLNDVWESAPPIEPGNPFSGVPYEHVRVVLQELVAEGLLERLPKRDGDGNRAWYRWLEDA